MSLLHNFFLFYFLFPLIIQAKSLKINPINPFFEDDIGCEKVQYPSEILTPLPYLKECLSTIDGLVVYPGDPYYYNSIKVMNCRYHYFPVVVIYVTTISDIQKSIHCANTLNISVTARSGGHSYEEYGNGGRSGVMVIDVQEFNQININFETKKTAVIGTGNRLGTIYYNLYKAGFLLPAGYCLNVGIGGHATGGGYGMVGRKYGMASDNIVSAEMVTANGTFISPINSNHHPDLFFAIRGAGNAGYGIITSLTFKIYPIWPIVTTINLAYFSDQIELAFIIFAKVVKNLSENLNAYIFLMPKNNNNSYTLSFNATYLGSEDEARSVVKELIELSNPAYIKFEEMPWWEAVKKQSPPFNRQPFKVTSYTIPPQGLSREAIRFLLNFINNMECMTAVFFDVYASDAISRIPVNSSAFIHRNILFVMELETLLDGHSKNVQNMCVKKHLKFSQGFQEKYTSYFCYQDYIDKDLPDWLTRYYGPHVPRLIETKKKYDPDNLFNWKQSIPTELP
ncbi:FAD-binding domain-containing protein [Gigaspora margarita]|uniref:FAD-binding domain-containing protein n=1 Tax=Gigaspora margarita TaxID=4874 RepID=A0A8H3X858_GIGMA|nr:FAD-binding domain-containing protein [Gigaspora margarita]